MKKSNLNFNEIQTKRRRRRFIIKTALFTLVIAGLSFGLIRFVFYSGFFRFTDIEFVNAESLDQEKVLSFLENNIQSGSFISRSLGVNNFLAWPKLIPGKDIPIFPEIEKLEIEKKYNENALVINAFVRDPLGIWCIRQVVEPKCFWFSEEGVIFKESLMPSGNLIKVVSDYNQSHLALGGKVLPDYLLENFISVFKVSLELDFPITEIVLDELENEEITVKALNGPEIYFSLRHKADSYLPVLNSLNKKASFKKLDYIDLRTENRVYYQ